jgi:hypothetical protein
VLRCAGCCAQAQHSAVRVKALLPSMSRRDRHRIDRARQALAERFGEGFNGKSMNVI